MPDQLRKLDLANVEWLFDFLNGINVMTNYWNKKAFSAFNFRLKELFGSPFAGLGPYVPGGGMQNLPVTLGTPPASTPGNRYLGVSVTFDNSLEDSIIIGTDIKMTVFRRFNNHPPDPDIAIMMAGRKYTEYPDVGAWATFVHTLEAPIEVEAHGTYTLAFYVPIMIIDIQYLPVLLFDFPGGIPQDSDEEMLDVPFLPADGWQRTEDPEDNLIVEYTVEFLPE